MADLVIRNVRIMQTEPPFDVQEDQDVVIEGSLIKEIGKGIASQYPGCRVIDGSGRTLIPGNVCSHHHYYSGLSRGMLVQAGPQTDFIQTLKEWWWRLDRALDDEAIYYSSLICSIDAISSGTTAAIDHHASPCDIEGSLSIIAKGMEEVGIRGATCFEVTDRNSGMEEVERGIKENVRFAREVDSRLGRGENVLCQAMIGGHAPFTIPDKGLEMMKGAIEETGRGMHLHVAEDKYDSVFSHHYFNEDIIDRLDRFGLLDEKTLLVHGVHLSDKEVDTLNQRGCFLAHNPRSNMNNQIGYNTRLPGVRKLVLGTDGCGGNMFEEIKIAFFKHRDASGPFWPADFLAALNRGNRLVESVFQGKGRWGRVEKGFKADLALLDYKAPTPLVSGNAAGHFVWGMSSNAVETVIVDGRVVMENRQFPGLDVERIYARARETASEVWKKVDTIKP